jgi:hypothetical protein
LLGDSAKRSQYGASSKCRGDEVIFQCGFA